MQNSASDLAKHCKKALTAILALSLSTWTTSAMAWNGRGHMIVAAVAWKHMSTPTRERAVALLKLNPTYETWIQNVPRADQGEVAFVIGATWPDLIKKWKAPCKAELSPNDGDPSSYVYCSDGEKPTHTGAAQNIGYRDKLEHKYWHYVDMPFPANDPRAKLPVPPNAKTQIDVFRTAIESAQANDNVKSYDLVWLEHLVGDVHQPLHATSHFSKTFPNGDQGANLVCLGTKLKVVKNKKTGVDKKSCVAELHAFWDSLLGVQKSGSDASNAEAAIAIADSLSTSPEADVEQEDESVWINESFDLAQSDVYVSPIKGGIGPYKMTARYRSKAKSIALARVELAGERLARLLNDHLK